METLIINTTLSSSRDALHNSSFYGVYVTNNDSFHSLMNDSDNNDNNNQHDYADIPTIKQPVHMIVIYSIAYSLVFLLGIFGNTMVVSVVYRNPRMHNVTNYFIVNLAIADILVSLFCLPITLLSNLYSGELLGHLRYTCRIEIVRFWNSWNALCHFNKQTCSHDELSVRRRIISEVCAFFV